MLDNTYDIPGIKFYLVFSKEGKNIDNIYSRIDIVKINFEDVDGLSIGDVSEGFLKNDFWLMGVCFFNGENWKGEHNFDSNLTIPIVKVDNKYVSKNAATPIDQTLEDLIMDNYSKLEDNERMASRCFLQRYRYGTRKKTASKILELQK